MSTTIDVTELHECAELLSASQAEMGSEAGRITWRNCLRKAEELRPINDGNRETARDHIAGFGAWEREEIDGWDDTELGALILQFAAGDIREAERCGVWDYESAEEERENEHPHMPGRLYFDPDGKVWYEMQDRISGSGMIHPPGGTNSRPPLRADHAG